MHALMTASSTAVSAGAVASSKPSPRHPGTRSAAATRSRVLPRRVVLLAGKKSLRRLALISSVWKMPLKRKMEGIIGKKNNPPYVTFRTILYWFAFYGQVNVLLYHNF
jgi:hypothetical protein